LSPVDATLQQRSDGGGALSAWRFTQPVQAMVAVRVGVVVLPRGTRGQGQHAPCATRVWIAAGRLLYACSAAAFEPPNLSGGATSGPDNAADIAVPTADVQPWELAIGESVTQPEPGVLRGAVMAMCAAPARKECGVALVWCVTNGGEAVALDALSAGAVHRIDLGATRLLGADSLCRTLVVCAVGAALWLGDDSGWINVYDPMKTSSAQHQQQQQQQQQWVHRRLPLLHCDPQSADRGWPISGMLVVGTRTVWTSATDGSLCVWQ